MRPERITIYVDESGDPGLVGRSLNKPYFVLGFVIIQEPATLYSSLRRLLKNLHRSGSYPKGLPELKFYPPQNHWKQKYGEWWKDAYNSDIDLVRRKTLNLIVKKADMVSAGVLDKRTVPNRWSSNYAQNYTFTQNICRILLDPSISSPPQVVYDRGRISDTGRRGFYHFLMRKVAHYEQVYDVAYRGHIPPPRDMDSLDEANLWAADMVAGAFFHKYDHNDASYADMLSAKMISQEVGV